jgi:ribulose-5-phosphate 4-epimerase/fuculose-1-phosphate aldolase
MHRIAKAAVTLATAGMVLVPATAAHAANGYAHIQSVYNGVVLGGVIFNGNGETAEVCDDNSDGRYVHGYIYWNGTSHELTDTNGAAAGCAHADYSIAENTPVTVWLCVDNIGCSDPAYTEA